MFDRSPLFPVIRGLALSVLLVFSLAAPGQEDSAASPSEQSRPQLPPVQQALVPEGVFALRLAEALKLGSPGDEAQAESLLGAAGIEPGNGWITEYPVTPAVIGDIDKAVAAAAEGGKLGMTKDQALKALAEVKTGLGLEISAGSGGPPAPASRPVAEKIYRYTDRKGVVHLTNEYNSIPEEYRSRATVIRSVVKRPPPPRPDSGEAAPGYPAPEDPDVINNYYYMEGPPAVTYYPPPEPYGYLYAWQPYPFWSYGYYFPGFFILRDFHRHVWYRHHPYSLAYHGGGWGRGFAPHPAGTFKGGWPHGFTAPPPAYYPPGIQRNARAIQEFHPRLPAAAPAGRAFAGLPERPRSRAPLNAPAPWPSQGAARLPPNPFPGPIHSGPRNFGIPPQYGYRGFNPPMTRGMPGYAPVPRFHAPRPMMPRFGGGQVFGGHGGSGFGGFRGGGGRR